MGLYPGTYLYDWLGPILNYLEVETFAKLRITQEEDEGMSLPVERRYRLLVHTSDVSRRVLARLPWDYDRYDKDRDAMAIIDAVRASMSVHGHEKVRTYGHERSALVATKSPQFWPREVRTPH